MSGAGPVTRAEYRQRVEAYWEELARLVARGLYIERASPGFKNEQGQIFRIPVNILLTA